MNKILCVIALLAIPSFGWNQDVAFEGDATAHEFIILDPIPENARAVAFCFRYRWKRSVVATNNADFYGNIHTQFAQGRLDLSVRQRLLGLIHFEDDFLFGTVQPDETRVFEANQESGFFSVTVTDPDVLDVLRLGAPLKMNAQDLNIINGPGSMDIEVSSEFKVLGNVSVVHF